MNELVTYSKQKSQLVFEKDSLLKDYRTVQESRQASLMGRKEVFMGKAKFGIFGDGKELAQIAMARHFQNGDFRAGYYRDQTFMFAIGESTIREYFAQLYAHTDVDLEPASAGRLMNGHFATRSLHADGSWKNLSSIKNSSADISPTAGQMPKLLGLAYASKLFRESEVLKELSHFSNNGNEVAWGTIGNASTSEGMFFETINAAGVLQVPMVVSIWDDGYGISVPNEYHTTKGSISEILRGFQRNDDQKGFEIFVVKGWDFEALDKVYENASRIAREEHVPVIIHVIEVTQPQGHSTSGSHERYKSKERLDWEKENDCILKFREYLLGTGKISEDELNIIDQEAKIFVKNQKEAAWKAFVGEIKSELSEASVLLQNLSNSSSNKEPIDQFIDELSKALNPIRKDVISTVRRALWATKNEDSDARTELLTWYSNQQKLNENRYNSFLYSQSPWRAENISPVPAEYPGEPSMVDGREVLQACFDQLLKNEPTFFAFGEDVGKIGDVNQAFAGLQSKYGESRVTDTGIRECTIIGQGIGAALRGLRPMAEIQYLDYIYYALMTLADDLACLQYRTKGGQKAPLIVRTRGHRLEGVWHAGSPIGMILHSLRGMLICVPRNMTQAAGMYNTLMAADEPALVIECLNGYRLKEKMPVNIGEFRVALGQPEVIKEGKDITVVTYGSMCRIVMDASDDLIQMGIDIEVIDVQTLLPFDINHRITESLKKTNKILFTDEDVPGGATAYMMQQVLEEQKGYYLLDVEPATLAGKAHRPGYSSDGDYFSKPSVDDVVEKVYNMMYDSDPIKYPKIF
jgi:pyruvate/2-oxoglutarate/acetoin dehydrogenase E1 component/TPP-dependent pyruvate/acetoin dehydrogenase alpha subunit